MTFGKIRISALLDLLDAFDYLFEKLVEKVEKPLLRY